MNPHLPARAYDEAHRPGLVAVVAGAATRAVLTPFGRRTYPNRHPLGFGRSTQGRAAMATRISDRKAWLSPSGFARSLGRALLLMGQALIAVLFLFGWIAVMYLLDASNAPEPTERCFDNHLTGETYCRSQRIWEIES